MKLKRCSKITRRLILSDPSHSGIITNQQSMHSLCTNPCISLFPSIQVYQIRAFSTRCPFSSNSIFLPVIKLSCNAQPMRTAATAPSRRIGGGVSSRQLAVNSLASVMKASRNRP